MLGAVAIFLYVGAEVAIGSFLVNFFKEPYIAGLAEAEGAQLMCRSTGAARWSAASSAPFTLRMFKPGKVLAVHAVGRVGAGRASTMVTTGSVAMWSILAVGLFNSIMFPTIFTLAIDGLGRHTGQGSGILCMAIVGGALIPVLQGVARRRDRHPPLLHHPGGLLRLHRLVRAQGPRGPRRQPRPQPPDRRARFLNFRWGWAL